MIFENSVMMSGKVIDEPQMNKTNGGKSVCKVNLIVEKQIGYSTRSDKIPIALWGKKSEIINDRLEIGDNLVVRGSVIQERWETEHNERRSQIVVQADKFWIVKKGYNHHISNEKDENEVEEVENIDETPEELEEEKESKGFLGGIW